MSARNLARWVLLCLLTCGASTLLAAEPASSQRWERDILVFEVADRASPPPQDAVLFVGSSTIRLWKTLAQDFPEHGVINRGFGGCHIADCTHYVHRIVIPYRPRVIVLRAGGNDIHAGKTPEQVRDDFQAFVENVRGKLPKTRIAYMTINASPARWANVEREKKANQFIKDYIAEGENLDYIDTFDVTMDAEGKPREELFVKDRLHFNAEGYKILAARVRNHLPPASGGGRAARPASADEDFYPRLATVQTRADREARAALEKPGKVFFQDDFESPESLKKYFEVRGLKEGRAKLVTDAKRAHSGKGAIQLTAPANDGKSSGAGASGWFGPEGYDRVHFRRYIRFAADYDQGNLNHVGGGLAAVAGADRYRGMGSAGIRPRGDDHFNSAFEPWRYWGRLHAPGYMFLYTYWMDMKRDKDGHYWGNMLGSAPDERIVLQRDCWYCLEHMIQVNDVGQANGELAAWIDGKLYIHYAGFRWRTSAEVKLKRFDIGVYVHQAKKDNTVWYDDVVLSTGYIGPEVQ